MTAPKKQNRSAFGDWIEGIFKTWVVVMLGFILILLGILVLLRTTTPGAEADTLYFDDLTVSPGPLPAGILEPEVPMTLFLAAPDPVDLGFEGVWVEQGAGAELFDFQSYGNDVFIFQSTIDTMVSELSTNPLAAVSGWDYWSDTSKWLYTDDAALTITPPSEVPLPAAAWMFLSAIGGLVVMRTRAA